MQPVSKKKSQKGGKQALILSILLLATGLAVLLFVLLQKQTTHLPAPEAEDHTVSLIDKPVDSLVRLDITPGTAPPYTLIKLDGVWQVGGSPGFAVNQTQASLMARDFTILIANELLGRVHLDEESLATLGLGKDAPRAEGHYQDGSTTTLVFGLDAKTEPPSDYLLVVGSDEVYGVSPETRDHFDRHVNTLHTLPALAINQELVSGIQFAGDDPLVLGQADGWWQINSPVQYPVNQQTLSSLLDSISKMRMAVYAGDDSTENLDRYGLATPRRTITLYLGESIITQFGEDNQPVKSQQVDAQTLTFSVGNNIDTLGFYCLYNGKIYQASNLSMGFLRDTGLLSLLSQTPGSLPINRLSTLTVQQENETLVYALELSEQVLPNNQLALDESGNTLYQPHITKNGEPYDSDAFSLSYVRLATIKSQGRLPESYTTKGLTPVIAYHLSGQPMDINLQFFTYDALHYAMQVNGKAFDFVLKNEVDAIGL